MRLGAQVEGAAHPDVVEMLVEEAARGAAAAGVKHAEEIVVGRKLGIGRIGLLAVAEHDAMGVDAAVLAEPDAARQPALVDQSGDELDGAVFGEQRGVEGDLVDAIQDVARRGRNFAALDAG